jgi:hypothetical protein
MKRILFLVLMFALVSSLSLADTASTPAQGVLISVSGKVQIKNKKGKKARKAKLNSTVVEGERIVTGTDAKATLQLFDGSQLDISPKTDFQLTKLQQPSATDKVIAFKLFVGRLFASVKKLASSKSSFEIEAGGVVCGVRGTKFHFEFDPGKNRVGLLVDEGTVYTQWSGHTNFFTAGQSADFTNGNLSGNPGGNNGGGNNGQGGNGQGGNKQGGNNLTGGNNPIGGSNLGGDALGDLGHSFGFGLVEGHNNGFTDPGVEGSRRLGIIVYVPSAETVR